LTTSEILHKNITPINLISLIKTEKILHIKNSAKNIKGKRYRHMIRKHYVHMIVLNAVNVKCTTYLVVYKIPNQTKQYGKNICQQHRTAIQAML